MFKRLADLGYTVLSQQIHAGPFCKSRVDRMLQLLVTGPNPGINHRPVNPWTAD